MKTYSKPILRIIAFFTGFLLLFLVVSYIFIPKNNSKEAGMDFYLTNGFLGEPENTLDVLIVGDSLTYSCFSPMLMWKDYGFTSYVCGSSAQPIYDSVMYIDKALRTQKPSIVVLEANTIFREVRMRNYLVTKVKKYLPLFRYHDRWKELTLQDFGGAINYTWTNDMKGFRYKTGVDGSIYPDYMAYSDEVSPIPKVSQICLDNLMDLCKEHNVPLMIVSAPCSEHWSYPNHNAIQAFADEHGLDFLDLNLNYDEFGLDWSVDTWDQGDHLNHQGAMKVSAYFGKYLSDKMELPDHRNDPKYAVWNDTLEKYKKTVNLK